MLSNNHSESIRDKLKFSCETAHKGSSSISVFQEIFISTDKIFISGEGQCTKSMKFWDFHEISHFPKILSFMLFANSWGNLYIQVCYISFHL